MSLPSKLKHNILFSFCCCVFSVVFSQTYAQTQKINVPEEIKINQFTFLFTQKNQKAIQTHINVLQENQKLLDIRIKNAQEYLPLVANILEKNKLPRDYKYLALMDNGEGNFWNFAQNRGWKLQNDNLVNENYNIVSLTERFTTFCEKVAPTKNLEWVSLIAFTSPNENWQAYLQEHFKDILKSPKNAQNIIELPQEIPDNLAKFFAHKLVFAPKISAYNPLKIQWVIEKTKNKKLSDIAEDYGVDYKRIKEANIWLKTDQIPNDKFYSVLIPVFATSPSENVEPERTRGNELQDDENIEYVFPADYDVHIVQRGEGIYSIARLHDVSPNDLMKWNNLNNDSKLKIGQEIRISEMKYQKALANNRTNQNADQNGTIIHQVKEKETLYSIAKQYKTDISQIKKWNTMLETKDLQVGQRLELFPQTNEKSKNKNFHKKTPSNNPSPRNASLRYAGIAKVASTVQLLGQTLTLDKQAQDDIQKRVNSLMRNATFFLALYDRKVAYQRLMQRVVKQEKAHPDFMFLAIQESELDGEAVSKSNAVGYWQMKSPVAGEMKLIMDNEVDERKHIIASTRAAMKYLKRNRAGFEGNWIKAALGYQMGFNGATNFFAKNEFLKNNVVTKDTPAYILKFIAYKIAFSQKVDETGVKKLTSFSAPPNTDIAQIAQEQEVDIAIIYRHNTWLKTKKTPKNRNVEIIIPAN